MQDPAVEPPFIDHGKRRLATALVPPLAAIAFMWLVLLFDIGLGLDLHVFGIEPRKLSGMIGIAAAPFLHGGVEHLLNNSSALLVLGWLLVYFYPGKAWSVVSIIALLGGLGVWLLGRDSYHIGASGVVYGMSAFLFVGGVLRKQVPMMAVSLIVVFLYGSMWWGVLPLMPGTSWESHAFGAVVGLALGWYYRKVPPAHVPPPLQLPEDEDDEEQTGDQEGDAVNEEELRWKRELAQRRTPEGWDPGRTDSTWPF